MGQSEMRFEPYSDFVFEIASINPLALNRGTSFKNVSDFRHFEERIWILNQEMKLMKAKASMLWT